LGKGLTGATGKFMEDLAEGQVQTATAALEVAQNQYEATEAALNRANQELEKAKIEAANNPDSYMAQQNLDYWTKTQKELDE
jgi:hypothetical protein